MTLEELERIAESREPVWVGGEKAYVVGYDFTGKAVNHVRVVFEKIGLVNVRYESLGLFGFKPGIAYRREPGSPRYAVVQLSEIHCGPHSP